MIRARIKQYLDYKGESKSEFYRKTNFSNGFLDSDAAMGSDKLETIISIYDDIDLYWAVTGKGDMIRKDIAVLHDEDVAYVVNKTKESFFEKVESFVFRKAKSKNFEDELRALFKKLREDKP